jgi:thioredoxin 1
MRWLPLLTALILFAATTVTGCRQNESLPSKNGLPRLIDVAAEGCMPCDMMAPVLKDLQREYKGKVRIDLIDMLKNPTDALRYGVRMIPTQIFFDAGGKELYRHTGYMSKEELKTTLARLGMVVQGTAQTPP